MTTKTASTAKPSTNGHSVIRLKASQIRVDPETQRQLRPGWARHLAENFDEDKLGIVHVSQRGRQWYVIDGQHRVFACRLAGKPEFELECKVHKSVTKADEARMFDGLNDQKAVGAFDRFKVRLNYDAQAQAVHKIIKSVGLKLALEGKPGNLAATDACEQVYTGSLVHSKEPTPWALSRTLRTLTGAWSTNRDASSANLIRGIGAVHLRYGDSIDLERLTRQLAKLDGGPLVLVGKAKIRRESTAGTLWRAIAEVVVDVYNKGLRKDPLPEFRR